MMRGKKVGFSMIEVVLVMGLAGLIFLMTFILLPQLQRNQRDSERKDDIMTFVQNLKKFQTNNRGTLPKGTDVVAERPKDGDYDSKHEYSTWKGFYHDYVEEGFADPDGSSYILTPVDCKGAADSIKRGEVCGGYNSSVGGTKISDALAGLNHYLVVFTHATCTENQATYADAPRSFAVVMRLESAGTFCQSS